MLTTRRQHRRRDESRDFSLSLRSYCCGRAKGNRHMMRNRDVGRLISVLGLLVVSSQACAGTCLSPSRKRACRRNTPLSFAWYHTRPRIELVQPANRHIRRCVFSSNFNLSAELRSYRLPSGGLSEEPRDRYYAARCAVCESHRSGYSGRGNPGRRALHPGRGCGFRRKNQKLDFCLESCSMSDGFCPFCAQQNDNQVPVCRTCHRDVAIPLH